MEPSTLAWVMGASVAQGLFLASALTMLNVRNQAARWLLVALILCLTLIIFQEFLEKSGLGGGIPLNFSGEFAIAPLLYLFVCALSKNGQASVRAHWPYFVPLGLSLLWTAFIYYGIGGGSMTLGDPATRGYVVATVPVKIAFFLGFIYFALTRPLVLSGRPDAARRRAFWIRALLWVAALSAIIAAISFTSFVLWPEVMIDSDIISAMLTVFAIYGLGYYILFNRDVLNAPAHRQAQSTAAPEAAQLHDAARAYLERSGAGENPDFALSDLAVALGRDEESLSKALSASAEGGFKGLLNDVRLAAFHRLLDEPANKGRTILELAYEAGFNSKATFYRHFQAREGMAPKAYIARRNLRGA